MCAMDNISGLVTILTKCIYVVFCNSVVIILLLCRPVLNILSTKHIFLCSLEGIFSVKKNMFIHCFVIKHLCSQKLNSLNKGTLFNNKNIYKNYRLPLLVVLSKLDWECLTSSIITRTNTVPI